MGERDEDTDAVDSLTAAVARAPTMNPGLVPGTVVDGTFRIERRIGSGGMGVVYLAHDVRLHRAVALKLHGRVGLASDEQALHEAKVTAQLSHPNVVTVHEVGTYEGQLFIAMEYVNGGTLRAWLREEPRRWREVLDMFVAAGRGLAAAHDARLVHGDFKADNVLVSSDGRVRVADFGLARALGQRAADPPTALLRAGTPAYMSPEQRRGDPIDTRSDQYSFCAALREALAVADRAPGWLQRAVARGLDDDPARRWPSMHDLLGRVAAHRRRRVVALAAAGVAIIALAASIVGWRLQRMAAAERAWKGGLHEFLLRSDDGRWNGNYGDTLMRTDASGLIRGVYWHDQGTIVGRIDGHVFRGWWCEAPTRKPPKDAGEVEFRFFSDKRGDEIDGRWRYGADGDWDESWDQHWMAGPVEPTLAPRFNDPSQFCPHP